MWAGLQPTAPSAIRRLQSQQQQQPVLVPAGPSLNPAATEGCAGAPTGRQKPERSGQRDKGQTSLRRSLCQAPHAARSSRCPRWPNKGGGSSSEKHWKSIKARPTTNHLARGSRFRSFPSQVFPLPTLKAEDERSAGGPEEPVRAPPTALAGGWLAFAQVLGQKGRRGRLATAATTAAGLKAFKAVIVKIPPLFSPAGGRR